LQEYKKFTKVFLIALVLIPIIGFINYIIDPSQQYRVDTFYKVPFSNERFQNAGFSKNYKYDSVVLGTSMVENFVIDEVQNKLNYKKSLKLCIAGGTAKEQSTTLQTALTNNPNIKNILWGLDTFSFLGDTQNLKFGKNSFPFYLYDDVILNDYKYLLSIDTVKDSLKTMAKAYTRDSNHISYDYNRMFQSQHLDEDKFTKQNIEKEWDNRDRIFSKQELRTLKYNYLKSSFDFNFLAILKENPQIRFKIFFPPYSILTHKLFEEKEVLEDVLMFKNYLYETLSSLDNVELYDFQLEKNITHNLNNYKDLGHYHQKINSWILNRIKDKNYLVQNESSAIYINKLFRQIKNYDASKIF